MNDLISRKAAIDALGKCPEAEWEEGWVATPTGEYKQWLFAYNAILSTPSTCAVPLDKLCEWLAGNAWHLDCSDCDAEHCDCPQWHDDSGSSPAFWKAKLTKWMEEQDATN